MTRVPTLSRTLAALVSCAGLSVAAGQAVNPTQSASAQTPAATVGAVPGNSVQGAQTSRSTSTIKLQNEQHQSARGFSINRPWSVQKPLPKLNAAPATGSPKPKAAKPKPLHP